MAASSSPLSSRDVDTMVHLLQCPITLEFYSQRNRAVSLIGQNTICGHTISERAARDILARRQCCPTCQTPIQNHYAYNGPVTELACLLISRAGNLKISAPIERSPPDIAAHFEVVSTWQSAQAPITSLLVKQMMCTSTVPNSLIQHFFVLGYTDSSVALRFFFRDAESKEGYLSSWELPIRFPRTKIEQYHTPDLKRAFEMLTAHNTVPEPYHSFIRALVLTGWRHL